VAVADINVDALETFAKELCGTYGEGNVLAVPTDVGKLEQVVRLRERVYEAWGEVRVVRRDSRPSPACPRKERGRDSPCRGAFPYPNPLFCF
jgi:hypothetical protein